MQRPAVFVIRVFPSDPFGGHQVDGVVERVEDGQCFPFHSAAELWRIVVSVDPDRDESKQAPANQ